MSGDTARLTLPCVLVIAWIVLATFNFGFGTSELNPLQNSMTCSRANDSSHCIVMSNSQFGYVTAAFTLGGFLGSLSLAPLKTHFAVLARLRFVLVFSSLFTILAGFVQAMASTWLVLALGRLLMGVGSGMALVTVPGYLKEVSPPHLQGSVGVLNQFSIVIGILIAQALGASHLGDPPTPSSTFALWRIVPLVSSAVALTQVIFSPLIFDAPCDVGSEVAIHIREKLWGTPPSNTEEGRALLLSDDEADDSSGESERESHRRGITRKWTVKDVVFLALWPRPIGEAEHASLRKGIRLIIFTQIAQQLSGVNAVLYFSTGILAGLFEGNNGEAMAKRIALGITFVNFLMTFPPIPLVQENRLGRKRLLQLSAGIMAVSATVLGFSLLRSYVVLAAISIVTFAAGFSLGLGPVPFLILPELVSGEVRLQPVAECLLIPSLRLPQLPAAWALHAIGSLM